MRIPFFGGKTSKELNRSMGDYTYLDNANAAYVEALYEDYQEDPQSVDEYWRKFFDGYEFAHSKASGYLPASSKEVAVVKLINAYRSRGHLIADTNPVRERRQHKADLELSYFGLEESDLKTPFDAGKELRIGRKTLAEILDHLKTTYCSGIGLEFMYCRDENIRQWIYENIEPTAAQPKFNKTQKEQILKKINHAVTFENFLHTKYVGKKRFSLEGLEALVPALDEAISESANLGAKQFILGMAHRGRLNVLTNIFGKDYKDVFAEFEGTPLAKDVQGDGDVKYHLGRSDDIVTKDGKNVHISLMPNPSHLEAVNPVVQGQVYARQETLYGGDQSSVIPILIHGDSAIAGQGINYEQVNMSKMDGYGIGGTIHIVTNNQLGFTTAYQETRSSVYCTDLAKVTESPVFHVNADNPEAVVQAVKWAIQIRMAFNIDVYVDILGYRKYGHNEGDEPRFTQPQLYKTIDKHVNVWDLYSQQLIAENVVTPEAAKALQTDFKASLQEKLDHVRSKKKLIRPELLQGHWKGLREPRDKDFESSIQTGVKKKDLTHIASVLTQFPENFKPLKKAKRIVDTRGTNFKDKSTVDWAMAEQLAYGSLLIEGKGVRLSGQDCQRGTFSHRHAVIRDVDTDAKYVPLNHLSDEQGQFNVYNSILSEYCVMGFEYGHAMAMPDTLGIWEAQFGDFSNGAQIMIDQFLSSSASKWQRYNGLTLFLPHGYEGQGPEHSSCRPERYLQLCAENNMYVCNPTTPANLFHMLRRQIHNKFRIPLVALAPKSLLRHPEVVSTISEMQKGAFQEIIDDTEVTASKVKRVVVCSGKIYYDLLAEKRESKKTDVAIVRLEQLYPLPTKQFAALKKRYKSAKEWIWAQEEPENMGGWTHILSHMRKQIDFDLVARDSSASTATGNEYEHKAEQAELVKKALNS